MPLIEFLSELIAFLIFMLHPIQCPHTSKISYKMGDPLASPHIAPYQKILTLHLLKLAYDYSQWVVYLEREWRAVAL